MRIFRLGIDALRRSRLTGALPALTSARLGASARRLLPALLALVVACAGDAGLGSRPRSAGPETPAGRLAERPGPSALDGLVFVVPDLRDTRNLDLWRARLSDGAVQPLIQTPDRREEMPTWSEHASALVFQTRSPYSWRSPPRLKMWQAGSEREVPGAHASLEMEPAWAPLDTRLVYVFRRLQPAGSNGIIHTGVAVLDVETGEQAILARSLRERYKRPTFSPDGRHVVAEYRAGRDSPAQIARLDAEGDPQLLTSDAFQAAAPSFTRDGRHIVFIARPAGGGPTDLMRMERDGSHLRPLAGSPESTEAEATPSPTRDEIAFLSDRDGKPDLFLVGTEGGAPRNLTASLAVRILSCRWSPDGEHLALSALPHEVTGAEESGLAEAHLLVIDRHGQIVFETRGLWPDWMPPWR